MYVSVTTKYDSEGNVKTYIKVSKDFIEAKYHAVARYNAYLKQGWNLVYGHSLVMNENNITFRLCDNEMDTNYIDFHCKSINEKGEF